ncbi:MAG: hypothetical protein R2719_02970 [Micropruina sp.]
MSSARQKLHQARADELLVVALRGTGTAPRERWTTNTTAARGDLSAVPDAATAASNLTTYVNAQSQVTAALTRSDWAAATALVTDGASAKAFTTLSSTITTLNANLRSPMRGSVTRRSRRRPSPSRPCWRCRSAAPPSRPEGSLPADRGVPMSAVTAPAAPESSANPSSRRRWSATWPNWTPGWPPAAELAAIDAEILGRRLDALTSDLQLSLALWQAVKSRNDLLLVTWDSGRVGQAECARLSSLIWGRLDTGAAPRRSWPAWRCRCRRPAGSPMP